MRNHLQSFIVHYAAIIAGACALVAKLDPSVLGPQGAAIVGAAVVGVALAHALGINPNVTAVTRVVDAASKQAGRASPALLAALAVTVAAVLVGCASFTKTMSNPASASAIEAAVDLAVGTTITQTAKTPAAQAAEAAQITTIASAMEGVLTGDQTTLAALDQVLRAKIAAANLPPPDQAAAAILVQTVQSILLQQIQGAQSKLTAADVVSVKAVLDDVIQAASFYGVHARAVIRAQLAPQ